jgi:alkylhydroperoxidase family enzyme
MTEQKILDDPTDLRQKSLVGIIWVATERGATHVVTLITFTILAHFLSPAEIIDRTERTRPIAKVNQNAELRCSFSNLRR